MRIRRISMSESFYGMELIGEGRNKWSYSVDGIEDFEEALNRKKQGLSLDGSVIGFLSYETGNGYKPFDLEKGVYFESRAGVTCIDGVLYFLKLDLNVDKIFIISYEPLKGVVKEVASLDFEGIDFYYSLFIGKSPVCVYSYLGDEFDETEDFVMYYPEKIKFEILNSANFICMDENKFYFRLYFEEENNYYHEIWIYDKSGKVISKEKGYLQEMPNGDYWILEK